MKCIYKLICFFFIGNMVVGQTKFEKESRLNIQDIPSQAKAFVFELTPSKKVKWYKEESIEGQSIEAKTCYQNKKYSIEFNMDGTLQDVEMETEIKNINTTTRTRLTTHLEVTFKKYKIKKIQIQYTATAQNLLDYFKTGSSKGVTIKYEIVLKGKTDLDKQLYEFTFLQDGTFENSKQIIFRNTDNIEF